VPSNLPVRWKYVPAWLVSGKLFPKGHEQQNPRSRFKHSLGDATNRKAEL